jgi:hypothetical protein
MSGAKSTIRFVISIKTLDEISIEFLAGGTLPVFTQKPLTVWMATKVLVRLVRTVVVKVTDQRVVDRGHPVTAGKVVHRHVTGQGRLHSGCRACCLPVLAL